MRASAGVGLTWISPFGPVKFFLTRAILKENYDKKEILDLVLVQHIKYKLRSNMKKYVILLCFIFLGMNLNAQEKMKPKKSAVENTNSGIGVVDMKKFLHSQKHTKV